MNVDEKINALIKRAGSTVMAVRNTQERDGEKLNGIKEDVGRILAEKFHGNVNEYIVFLVDTVDRLEAALHNTVNERDALIEIVKKDAACLYCKYNNPRDQKTCKQCFAVGSKWEWRGLRGVPGSEEKTNETD